jgi:hypothetical protein
LNSLILKNKILEFTTLGKILFLEFYEFLKTDKGQKIIALIPLFFSWVPILISKFDHPEIKKKCIISISLTSVFLASLILSYTFSMLPFIGGILANLIHFLGVGIYLSCSIFLVYAEMKNKNIEFKLLSKVSQYLEKKLL